MYLCVCVVQTWLLLVACRMLTVSCVAWQEGYWRAVLFGEHIERRRLEDETFNENAKTETTVTLQESLMRLFAVCIIVDIVLDTC